MLYVPILFITEVDDEDLWRFFGNTSKIKNVKRLNATRGDGQLYAQVHFEVCLFSLCTVPFIYFDLCNLKKKKCIFAIFYFPNRMKKQFKKLLLLMGMS